MKTAARRDEMVSAEGGAPATVTVVTVAVFVKVYEGVVLATDSATTLSLPNGDHQVYNNANKIFHLHRDLPIAAMTWGLGNVGAASISTLAKDFRQRLMDQVDSPEGPLNPDTYTVEEVATRLRDMIYVQLADKEYEGELGFLVAGYSSNASHPEAWVIAGKVGGTPPPDVSQAAAQDGTGWAAYAQPTAVTRLFNGYDYRLLPMALAAVPDADKPAVAAAFEAVRADYNPVHPAMPIVDAIKLARFAAETTSNYTRFRWGSDTVGGPVEVAALTRHEGFKWISRKHYFTTELNPGGHP